MIKVLKINKQVIEKIKTQKHCVYIGRKNKYYDLEESVFANPFFIDKKINNREEVISKYSDYLNSKVNESLNQPCNPFWRNVIALLDLEKEVIQLELYCWCKPKACHGDVLKVKLIWLRELRARVTNLSGEHKFQWRVSNCRDKLALEIMKDYDQE